MSKSHCMETIEKPSGVKMAVVKWNIFFVLNIYIEST